MADTSVEPHAHIRFAETSQIHVLERPDSEDLDDLDDVHLDGPNSGQMLRRHSVAAESFNPEEMSDSDGEDSSSTTADSGASISAEQHRRLEEATRSILIFRCLDSKQLSRVIQALQRTPTRKGQRIISQDDEGHHFYVIERGTFDIFVRDCNGADQLISTLVDAGSFGELALMYNTPRAASVVCSSAEGVLWSLDRPTFRRIVLKRACMKRRKYEALLNRVELLSELSEYERANLADALLTREVPDGEKIFSQGDAGVEMFIVEEGEVSIVRHSTHQNMEEKELKRVSAGGYFGELALLTQKPRVASAIAVGPTKLSVLDRFAFERLMGPVKAIMLRNTSTYRKILLEVFGSEEEIPELLSLISL